MTMKKVNMNCSKICSQSRHNECKHQGESERTKQSSSNENCSEQCSDSNSNHGRGDVEPVSCVCEHQGDATVFHEDLETPGDSSDSLKDRQASVFQKKHSDNNVTSKEDNPRKREKIGFFKSLQRRLSFLSVNRKSKYVESSTHLRDCHLQRKSGCTPNAEYNGDLKDSLPQNNTPDLISSSFSLTVNCETETIRLSASKNIDPRVRADPHSSFNQSSPPEAYLSSSELQSNRTNSNPHTSKEESDTFSTVFPQVNPVSTIQSDNIEFQETAFYVANGTKANTIHHTDSVPELTDCVESNRLKERKNKSSVRMPSLAQELLRLSRLGWYWGPISRSEAEGKLTNQPDGAFLVRDSSDERYLLSISFRSLGCIFHSRIEHYNRMFSFSSQPDIDGFPSIVELIEQSMNKSQAKVLCFTKSSSTDAQQFPVRFTKPVSRYMQVRSLQYLCRFVIRQNTRCDHIQQLPLPSKMKSWIEESQY